MTKPILERTLYVTSFTETMFRLSGYRLIDSFLHHKLDNDGDLLCCAEGFICQMIIMMLSYNII